jgi:hypothetical protein
LTGSNIKTPGDGFFIDWEWYGSFAAGSRSMIGIGNTSALGYAHYILGDGWGCWELCSEWERQVELVYFIDLTFLMIYDFV